MMTFDIFLVLDDISGTKLQNNRQDGGGGTSHTESLLLSVPHLQIIHVRSGKPHHVASNTWGSRLAPRGHRGKKGTPLLYMRL